MEAGDNLSAAHALKMGFKTIKVGSFKDRYQATFFEEECHRRYQSRPLGFRAWRVPGAGCHAPIPGEGPCLVFLTYCL